METKNGIQAIYAKTRTEWREWLDKNGQSEKSVYLIIYHKNSKARCVHYEEAIEEALCFGWIDGKANKRDNESFYLSFTQRKPKSNWSKINRERAAKLIQKGLMTPSGQAHIDHAKNTGTWELLLNAQNNVIPDDLQQLFNENKTAYNNFQAFPPSSKRLILEWVSKAKKIATRQQRIVLTVELAAQNIKAAHHR